MRKKKSYAIYANIQSVTMYRDAYRVTMRKLELANKELRNLRELRNMKEKTK